MSELTFHHYMQISHQATEQTFKQKMEASGYYAFYNFVEDFREGLKSCSDENISRYLTKIKQARELFPTPEQFSPSWSGVWDEFAQICHAKQEVLGTIPETDRDGEWQILIDNPYSHQQVVCYPSLPFLEAAYMYGYFQNELKPHECLRLQRIVDLLSTNGRKEATLFPNSMDG